MNKQTEMHDIAWQPRPPTGQHLQADHYCLWYLRKNGNETDKNATYSVIETCNNEASWCNSTMNDAQEVLENDWELSTEQLTNLLLFLTEQAADWQCHKTSNTMRHLNLLLPYDRDNVLVRQSQVNVALQWFAQTFGTQAGNAPGVRFKNFWPSKVIMDNLQDVKKRWLAAYGEWRLYYRSIMSIMQAKHRIERHQLDYSCSHRL